MSALQPACTLEAPGADFAHGSPRHPIWEYIFSGRTATQNFAHFTGPVCFVGHTHVPVIYAESRGDAVRIEPSPDEPQRRDGRRWLVNPGSVGQPRDGDPRASYLLYDPVDGTVTYRRVVYDVAGAQARILAAGLPSRLAERLDTGH